MTGSKEFLETLCNLASPQLVAILVSALRADKEDSVAKQSLETLAQTKSESEPGSLVITETVAKEVKEWLFAISTSPEKFPELLKAAPPAVTQIFEINSESLADALKDKAFCEKLQKFSENLNLDSLQKVKAAKEVSKSNALLEVFQTAQLLASVCTMMVSAGRAYEAYEIFCSIQSGVASRNLRSIKEHLRVIREVFAGIMRILVPREAIEELKDYDVEEHDEDVFDSSLFRQLLEKQIAAQMCLSQLQHDQISSRLRMLSYRQERVRQLLKEEGKIVKTLYKEVQERRKECKVSLARNLVLGAFNWVSGRTLKADSKDLATASTVLAFGAAAADGIGIWFTSSSLSDLEAIEEDLEKYKEQFTSSVQLRKVIQACLERSIVVAVDSRPAGIVAAAAAAAIVTPAAPVPEILIEDS